MHTTKCGDDMGFVTETKRIILAYSTKHFMPGAVTGKEFTSAGQLARYLYEALEECGEVHYSDDDHAATGDMVVTPYMHRFDQTTRMKRIAFPAIAHPAYTDAIIAREAARYGEASPHYRYQEVDIAAFHQGFLNADRIVLIGNDYVRSTYLDAGVDAARVSVIPSGVDGEHFSFCPRAFNKERPVFLHSATMLSVRKGIHYVLDAWPRVHAALPGAQLIILGREGSERAWRDKAKQPQVTVLGGYENGSASYLEILARAHVVVLPSLSEGQPGTLLEAMARGCVPVAPPSAGIDVERSGGIACAMASAESLAKSMLAAVAHEDEWQKRSRTVRATVERDHAWKVFKQTMRAIVHDVI